MKLLLLQLKMPLSQFPCVHVTNTKRSTPRPVLYAKRLPFTKTSPSCARAHGWTSKPERAVTVISLLYNTDHHISISHYVGKPGSCCTGDTHVGAAQL